MAFVITEGCVDIKDKTCVQNCPVDCIYEGDRMTYIHPDECIDCGACEPLCPQEAIFYSPDVAEKLLPFIAINAEFFTELGSPGDARAIDVTNRDHPVVAALPPRPTAVS
jgi:NAD-dependent dihydropyrimidine dehydrogenase PreA subunit